MASEYEVSGVPFLRSLNVRTHRIDLTNVMFISEEFHAKLRKSALRPGDVVTVRTGKPGVTAVIPESLPRANCSDLVITRPGPELDSVWLSYFINGAASGYVASRLVGAVQQHFNVSSAKELRLLLPPLEEQRAIAATLGALDNKIESNRNLTQTAAALVRALYTEAAAGRDRGPFRDAMTVSMGTPFKGAHYTEPGIGRPLLRIRDLKTFVPQTWTTEQRHDESVIEPGSIVVGMDAEFRATIWLGDSAVLNQRVCAFRPLAPVGRAFALHSLEADLALQERAKSGTTVIHLNKADIQRFRVPIFSHDEHRALAAMTDPLIDMIVARSAESKHLARMRDALMPELLSGRLRANDVSESRFGGTV